MFLSFDNYKKNFEKNKIEFSKLDEENKNKWIDGIYNFYNKKIPLIEYNKKDIDFSFNNLLKNQKYSITTNCDDFKTFEKYKLNNLINFIKNNKALKKENLKNDFLNFHITINDEEYFKHYIQINNISNYYQNKQRLKCVVNKYKSCDNYYKKEYKKLYKKYFSSYKYETGLIIHEIDFKKMKEYEKSINLILFQELIQTFNKLCTVYKPYLFKLFINIFKPINKKAKILDLSSGWGDRIFGVLSIENEIEKYIGIDPNKNLLNGYNKMINDFSKNKQKYELIQLPAEEVNYSKLCNDINIIFWSPPFFIQEDYVTDDTREDFKNQSTNKFKTYEEWEDNFLINVINLSSNNLELNGILILYIGNINYESFFKKMENIKKLKYLGVIHLKANNIKDYHIFIKTEQSNKCMFIKNSNDTQIMDIKNKLLNNDDNPKLNIIKINVDNKIFNVVQENVLIVGTKQRMVVDLLKQLINKNTKNIVYASSYMGYGAVATAYGAYKLGLRCSVFLDMTKMGKIEPEEIKIILNSRQIKTLMALNAKIYLCDNYRNARNLEYDYSTLVTVKKEFWKIKDDYIVPDMGFNDKNKIMVNILSKKIKKASKNTIINEIENVRIWLVAGSGGIAESLKLCFPNSFLFIYITGGGIYYKNVEKWIKTQKNVILLNNNEKYKIDNIHNNYYDYYESVENYDSVIFPYVKKYGLSNDFIWNVCSD